MSLNLTIFSGNLVAEPEVRVTQSGKSVANFRIAQTARRKGADGEWEDGATTFMSVTAWGKYAEAMSTAQKGDEVTVVGRLEDQEWADKKTGDKRRRTDIIAEKVIREQREAKQAKPTGKPKAKPAQEQVDYGDIPF